MTIGDIIYNDNIEFDDKFLIYRTGPGETWDEGECVFYGVDNTSMSLRKPSDAILDMPVTGIAIENNTLILVVPAK